MVWHKNGKNLQRTCFCCAIFPICTHVLNCLAISFGSNLVFLLGIVLLLYLVNDGVVKSCSEYEVPVSVVGCQSALLGCHSALSVEFYFW